MKKSTLLVSIAFPILIFFGLVGLNVTGLPIDFSSFSPDSLSRFAARVFPPDFSEILEIWPLFNQTLQMTLWGTLIGGAFAYLLSLFGANKILDGSRTSGLVIKAIAIFSRSLPDLLIAFIFVTLIGSGTLAGIMTLALTSIGMFIRLLSTRIEEITLERALPFVASGMSKTSLRFSFVAREIWPYFSSIFGYRLDINLRSAATLGLAGAGGLGIALKMYFGSLNYPAALAIVIVIAACLLFIEFAANAFNIKLAGESKKVSKQNSPLKKLIGWLSAIAVSIYMIVGLVKASADAKIDYATVNKLLLSVFTPDFTSRSNEILTATIQSVSLAALGMFFGGILALLVGIGGSRKTNLPTWVLITSRTFLVLKRSAPTVLFAIIFVIIFGMGSLAGVAALTLGVGGIGAKFIADSLDEIPTTELTSLNALGLNRAQYLVSGILRIGFPTLIKHLLYMFELNIRYSAIIGIIGVGGIGVLVTSALRNGDLQTCFAVIYVVCALVAALEFASRKFTKVLV